MIYPKNILTNRKLFHASRIQGLKIIVPKETLAYADLGKLVFASRIAAFAACFGTPWSDQYANVEVMHTKDDDSPTEMSFKQVTFNVMDKNKVDLDLPCSMYQIEGKFKYLEYYAGLEQVSPLSCKVINEIRFKTFRQLLEYYHVDINE